MSQKKRDMGPQDLSLFIWLGSGNGRAGYSFIARLIV